jgi:putative ABC transport system permease protein
VFQVLALLLLLIACANVAMLVFARTATRLRELAVRNALGASRARIVSQVFTEALVLAVLAAAAGLVGFHWMLKGARAMVLARGLELPYWLTLGVTGQAVVSALLLAVVSAGVAGIVPALRITGRGIRQVIERAGARGPGFRFGGVTGVLIVADVAIAVAVVSVAAVLADRMWDAGNAEALVGIPAEEYLAVQVRLPADETGAATDGASDGAFVERLSSVQQLLLERLEAEPRVRAVAVASGLPRMDQWSRRVEIEGVDSPGPRSGQYMSIALVDVDFFKALNQRMVSGRGFDRGDLDAEVVPVVVNTVFADRMLGGRSPVGRRLRFVRPDDAEEAPWHEIIGVVGHLGMDIVNPQGGEGIYVPAPPGGIHPIQIAIHLGDAPETFAPRLRELAAEIDPTLVLGDPVVLSRVYQGDWYLTNAVAGGLGLLVAVLVALAASGLYAILSFSVSERTKEIGIRTALGASRRSLVLTILRRSLSQVALGALIGMPFAARVFFALRRDAGQGGSTGFSLLAALVVGGLVVGLVGLLSSVVPARRILGIDASAALRAEG